jgi:hypothetical protein
MSTSYFRLSRTVPLIPSLVIMSYLSTTTPEIDIVPVGVVPAVVPQGYGALPTIWYFTQWCDALSVV